MTIYKHKRACNHGYLQAKGECKHGYMGIYKQKWRVNMTIYVSYDMTSVCCYHISQYVYNLASGCRYMTCPCYDIYICFHNASVFRYLYDMYMYAYVMQSLLYHLSIHY